MKFYFFVPISDYDSLLTIEKTRIINISNSRSLSEFKVATINDVDNYVIESDINLAINTKLIDYPLYSKKDAVIVLETSQHRN